MNKIFTIALLGAGSRANGFCCNFGKMADKYKITAVCDINPKQIEKIKKNEEYLKNAEYFYDEESFFEKKRADAVVISTFDKEHVRQCIRAMRLGYDVLLEKPVSDSEEELLSLLRVQEETGRKVVVYHELRYGPAYVKISELLNEGAVGKIMAIDSFERVAYWHQAQAYVRIQSEFNSITHPTILAKCSHDLDLIGHYAQSRCETASSVGDLGFFTLENAPEGSTERCVDCPHVETCPYSAKKIYIDGWKKDGCPEFVWPYAKVSLQNPNTEENLCEGIETTYFGKCVFRLNVGENEHVVDRQMVQMRFENGICASLKMVFGGEPGRRINIFGSHGEILMDERREVIEIYRYGEEKQVLKFENIMEGGHGHGGGDGILAEEFYDVLLGKREPRTSLKDSLEAHLIGIAAEKSRLSGGSAVKVHNIL